MKNRHQLMRLLLLLFVCCQNEIEIIEFVENEALNWSSWSDPSLSLRLKSGKAASLLSISKRGSESSSEIQITRSVKGK